jgi:DNA-binding response OmpR family regulator
MAAKRRIFVVEDHPTTARALKVFLETQGYDVSVAGDVSSALKFAANNTFDLLICDLSLPDGNGWDLIKKLCANGPVRGIAFTASGSDEDIAQSKKAGFVDHVVKGCAADELVAVIEQTLKLQPKTRNSRRRGGSSPSQNGAIKV